MPLLRIGYLDLLRLNPRLRHRLYHGAVKLRLALNGESDRDHVFAGDTAGLMGRAGARLTAWI